MPDAGWVSGVWRRQNVGLVWVCFLRPVSEGKRVLFHLLQGFPNCGSGPQVGSSDLKMGSPDIFEKSRGDKKIFFSFFSFKYVNVAYYYLLSNLIVSYSVIYS